MFASLIAGSDTAGRVRGEWKRAFVYRNTAPLVNTPARRTGSRLAKLERPN
jgi:hypothetical protein